MVSEKLVPDAGDGNMQGLQGEEEGDEAEEERNIFSQPAMIDDQNNLGEEALDNEEFEKQLDALDKS